jgi:hypothetical protein
LIHAFINRIHRLTFYTSAAAARARFSHDPNLALVLLRTG